MWNPTLPDIEEEQEEVDCPVEKQRVWLRYLFHAWGLVFAEELWEKEGKARSPEGDSLFASVSLV